MTTAIGLIIIIQVIQLWFVVVNLRYFLPPEKIVSANVPLDDLPTISVLIPARDEEDNIKACIESVYNQSILPLDVRVLNDHSVDKTGEILTDLQSVYPTLKVYEGRELPEGWLGKSFACHQLAERAQGDWFLLLDADVRLMPMAIESILPVLKAQKTGMISGFPKQHVVTLAEKLMVPMMLFTVLMHLPLKYVTRSHKPRFAAAHGGFIAIEKNSYQKAGGHEAIRTSLLDDMSLMKKQKALNQPVRLLKVDPFVQMRMYHSFQSVWLGFQKNMFSLFNKKVGYMLGLMSYYTVLFLLPFCFLPWVDVRYVLFSYGLMVLTKLVIDWRNAVPKWLSFFIPISILFMIGIGIDSMYKSLTHRGYIWKGRRYQ